MCASAVDRLVGVRIVDDWSWGIGIAAAVAGLIGVPCAIWLLERQETRSASFATWGAAAGAVPLLATLVSGMIGRYARGGMAWLTEFMAHSAPIPLIGATPWPVFLQWELRNILIGAISGLMFWAAFVRTSPVSLKP
jgi:hypothetical protein